MSLVIRMARAGTKKRPVYHIVVADFALTARRPLHRAARLFQSAAAEGKDRAAQARSRQGAGLDEEGRAAVRPRHALPRRRRHREARKAQQSGKGDPAQGTQGEGRGSHQGQGSRRRRGQDRGHRQGRGRQGRGRQGQGRAKPEAGRSAGGELMLAASAVAEPHPRRPHRCRARHSRRGEAVVVHRGSAGGRRTTARWKPRTARGVSKSKRRGRPRITWSRGSTASATATRRRSLRNTDLFVPRDRLPAIEEADTFYHADLVGLAAVSEDGAALGTVSAIHNFGAGDLIEIAPAGRRRAAAAAVHRRRRCRRST